MSINLEIKFFKIKQFNSCLGGIMSEESYVVDRAESKISDLWKKEDYWAIWIGLLLCALAIFTIMPTKSDFAKKIEDYNAIIAAEKEKPYETLAYVEAMVSKKNLVASSIPNAKAITSFLATPKKWNSNPLESMVLTQEEADARNASLIPQVQDAKEKANDLKIVALAADEAAKAANYGNEGLNTAAEKAIGEWSKAQGDAVKLNQKMIKPYNLIPKMLILGVILAVLMSIGILFMGQPVGKFIVGFVGVFILCIIAQILGKQSWMSSFGINAEIWSIVIGMAIANTISTPKWMMPGVQVEYYIKTGLVLLGAEVLFNKIVAIGLPGIFIAWIVTPIVLITTYIFGQKVLKMPSKTLNIVISADMSVCGTSAAIATAAACRAKKEELTLSIGISLTFTAIMMIVLPVVIKAIGLDEVVAGAWIGGTIDATGAVAAAGAFIGPTAMQVAATIKMIQNVLIGVTAFGVAVYWCTKVEVDCTDSGVSVMEIWHRFPKFVIGFLIASVMFSVFSTSFGPDLGHTMVDKGMLSITKGFRGWFFALSFISIGLATNFRDFAKYFKGGKPIILYVCGQSFNLALTLFMAWLMFHVVFPDVTAGLMK